jgi:[ribosomal protein S18]-alanine N-acetyltransferase
MRIEDVEEVIEVEKACFSLPWPLHAYRREVEENRMSRYVVARMEPDPSDTSLYRLDKEPGNGSLRHTFGNILRPFRRDTSYPPPQPPAARIAGYGGVWFMLDEAHVTTIGVRPDLRGTGIGELVFASLLHIGRDLGAARVTLEVRVSNVIAQNLYRKYGFTEEGVRKRYYSDNNEDALILWSPHLDTPEYEERMAELGQVLDHRLNGQLLTSAWGQGAWSSRMGR